MNDRLWRAAFHEAGHAIVSLTVGFAVLDAMLTPNGSETLGRVRYRDGDLAGNPATRPAWAMVLLAGSAAETKAFGECRSDRFDLESLRPVVTAIFAVKWERLDQVLDRFARAAVGLVDAKWPAICAVAATLVTTPGHMLDGADIAKLVRKYR